jgi:predicted DNA-binding transcriptional regulator AlpA
MERVRERPINMGSVLNLTGFTRSYIYKLVNLKKIPCHKPTNGRLFFYESEILDFLSRRKQSADYEVSERADATLNGESQ